jgi:hypothetical protein
MDIIHHPLSYLKLNVIRHHVLPTELGPLPGPKDGGRIQSLKRFKLTQDDG